MSDLPSVALSKSFEDMLRGRKLACAVFTTFQLDPEFFEQEILPVFLDMPLSHATPIRRVQLEDALRTVPGEIALYYDANGLCVGDRTHARQDVRRIPVRLRGGRIFHPKLVFALVSSPTQDDPAAQALIVGTLSANLTRTGWWENVEVAFIEEVRVDEKSATVDGLVAFLKRLRKLAPGHDHAAVDEVLTFLRRVPTRRQRSDNNRLHTHFIGGDAAVTAWMADVAGGSLKGLSLEIIAPYFDDAEDCLPLEALVDAFRPTQVRVLLPSQRSGVAACSERMFDAVEGLSDRATIRWGTLPEALLRRGNNKGATERFVHAKLYRFFSKKPAREIFLCGSVNMTQAAHQRGGNIEAAVLTETQSPRKPDFWLQPLSKRPAMFEWQRDEGDAVSSRGTRVQLRYDWTTRSAEIWWDDTGPSPALVLLACGARIASLPPSLPPRDWVPLDAEITADIQRALQRTSLFEVVGDRDVPIPLLVQEEGMAGKPSLLLELSPADILKYWSLLTPEQRAAFIETRGAALVQEEAGMAARLPALSTEHDLFGEMAGIFHAFGSLERSVRAALQDGRTKEAVHRIFGRKYDSLGNLLEGVLRESEDGDSVHRYLILLCARQLCDKLEAECGEFWRAHEPQSGGPREALAKVDALKQLLLDRNGPEFADFLRWFEGQFLKTASPREVT